MFSPLLRLLSDVLFSFGIPPDRCRWTCSMENSVDLICFENISIFDLVVLDFSKAVAECSANPRQMREKRIQQTWRWQMLVRHMRQVRQEKG